MDVGAEEKAVGSFEAAGFNEPEFYVTSADNLPFVVNIFGACLCILSVENGALLYFRAISV